MSGGAGFLPSTVVMLNKIWDPHLQKVIVDPQ